MPKRKTKIAFIFFTLFYLFSSTVLQTFAAMNYTYDADGNMSSDGSKCYTYNDENQLSQIKDCGSGQVIAVYVYDYQGNRLIKKNYVNGTLNNTVYSPEDEYETKKLASNSAIENTTYYFANGQQIAKKNPDGSKLYLQDDNLGSANVVTAQNGSLVESTTYYPFGEVRSGGTKDKYQYTGQEKDSETNLDYYNSRYYNAHLHRFIQADTLLPNVYNPQELNRYSYVDNNPLTYTDPSGHCLWDGCIIEGIGVYELALLATAAVAAVEVAIHPAQAKAAVISVVSTVSKGISVAANAVKSIATASQSKSISIASPSTPKSNPTTPSNTGPSGNSSPKIPNTNPFQRIAPLIPLAGPASSPVGRATINQGLDAAEEWLGNEYSEIAPGVFRSSDNLRQFRMTDSDIFAKIPHFNFETVGEDSRMLLQNAHVYLIDMNK